MRSLSWAERLLRSLGVQSPEDIDLDAIARHMGVLAIRERRLDGCEARIVGIGNNAVISVSAAVSPQRRRFSICHELGHWHHHRGETLYCKAADIGDREVVHAKEKVANTFAADLMLPPYIVADMAASYREVTVKCIDDIRAPFMASRSATAIQVVRLHRSAAMVVFNSRSGRQWHARTPGIPMAWVPRRDLGQDSSAFGMIFGTPYEQPQPRRVRAHAWFDRRGAEQFEITEQSFAVGHGEVVTLLALKDPRMLEDGGVPWR